MNDRARHLRSVPQAARRTDEKTVLRQEREREVDWAPTPDSKRWARWREGEGWTMHERPTGSR